MHRSEPPTIRRRTCALAAGAVAATVLALGAAPSGPAGAQTSSMACGLGGSISARDWIHCMMPFINWCADNGGEPTLDVTATLAVCVIDTTQGPATP